MQVKEAVERASHYLPEIFPSAEEKELRLEGVDKTDDGHSWKITLSYVEQQELGLAERTSLKGMGRVYKTVKLRDSDGEFMGARNGLLLEAL